MIEALKIFLIGLLFWRVLIIFYRPKYLKFEGSRTKPFRIDFGKNNRIFISRVFLWQIFTFIGTFALVYFIHLKSQEWRYESFQLESREDQNLGEGRIVRKGGYILRRHPMNALIGSNIVNREPFPVGSTVSILDTLDQKKWYKVKIGRDSGYVSGAAIIENTEAEEVVREFIKNLESNKLSACEQLIRWKGNCEDFDSSPLYGGVKSTNFDRRDVNLVSVENGRVVVHAKYEAFYDPESYFKLRRTTRCLFQYSNNGNIRETRQKIINNRYSVGFSYDEDFYVMKLSDGSLQIWDHVLQEKECVPERLPYQQSYGF